MKMRCLTGLVALVAASAAAADTIHVPAGGDIQKAINMASDGDVIQLEEGLYQPNSTIRPGGRAITIRGVLGDDGEPASVIDGQDSISVIWCISGEGSDTRFERLVITRGRGSADGGGGMYTDFQCNPTLDTCLFLENKSDYLGGGMYNFGSSPTLLNCIFRRNTTAGYGGGIYNEAESSPSLTNCVFEENETFDYGGGMYSIRSSPSLDNCTFIGNTSAYGGGIANEYGSTGLADCTFGSNVAHTSGGGMYNFSNANVVLTGCSLCANTPNQIEGPWQDGGGNTFSDRCDDAECDADLTGDGLVDGADLNILLGDWGQSASVADITDDGLVDGADLNILLGAWGVCP
ncbi:MAG: hypothetical protein MK101_12480 [Phycisphaerales bacterium]|nr:hypothetical protein [Phycisphaerales bacterium]